ncbi:MAG: WYL domain-containing protein [Planctomycetes bacterium]|nr:WYL domain-containing protein [Planctomycetota bacterium]
MANLNYATLVHRLLTRRRGWRVSELRGELGVAERTYRHYRQTLQEQFLPFFREGKSRVEEVGEGEARCLRLADPEGEKPHVAQLLVQAAAGRLARMVLAALGREDFVPGRPDLLGHASEGGAGALACDLDRVLYFVPSAPKDYSAQGEVLEALLQALVDHHPIRLSYEALDGEANHHELEPLTLALHRGGLHLFARYPGKERIYNYVVDRMLEVEVHEEHFVYPPDYQPEQVLHHSFGIFVEYPPRETHEVELLFVDKAWLKRDLLERTWHPSQHFAEQEDGRLLMTFRVGSLIEVSRWVLSFGDEVEVLKPDALLRAQRNR